MFERITIRQRSGLGLGQPLDLGVLAEALIFYSEVRLLANRMVLRSLLTAATPEVLVELLEQGFLTLVYEAEEVGIMTAQSGTPAETHEPVYFGAPDSELHTLLPDALKEIYGKSGKARRVANRLAKKIETVHHSNTLLDEAREDLSNAQYVQSSVDALMRMYVPEYEGSVDFQTRKDGAKLLVSSNIRFDDANRIYHQRIPATHSSLTPAYLLAHLMSVKADLTFAARYNSEIATDEANALIVRQHVGQLFQRLQMSADPVGAFQEFVFDDSRAIADAVRTGGRPLGDLLPILPKAAKFKEWLRNEAPQRDVVKAYFREAFAPTWIDKLPSKFARWFFFAAAGMGVDALGAGGAGTLGGIGLGVVDAFLLDKMLRGWKPNQFVDDHLRKLIPPSGRPRGAS